MPRPRLAVVGCLAQGVDYGAVEPVSGVGHADFALGGGDVDVDLVVVLRGGVQHDVVARLRQGEEHGCLAVLRYGQLGEDVAADVPYEGHARLVAGEAQAQVDVDAHGCLDSSQCRTGTGTTIPWQFEVRRSSGAAGGAAAGGAGGPVRDYGE